MIKQFYNRYSDEQKVSFWSVVSNIFLVIFTFGFGILIQDSMLRSNQKISNAIVRYDYGSRLFPSVKSIYSENGTTILFELQKWENMKDKENSKDSLYEIYRNNREEYLAFTDTVVHVLGTLKYYFPDYKKYIADNNTKIITINNLLHYLHSVKNRVQIPDAEIPSLLESFSIDPDLWIYGGGADLEILASEKDLIKSVNYEIAKDKPLEDSIAVLVPELHQPFVDWKNNDIVAGEHKLIVKLNEALLSNLMIFEKINNPDENGPISNFNDFFTWQWLVFIVAIVMGIVISIFFTTIIFPRKLNRNHSSSEYKRLEEMIERKNRLITQYESLLSSQKGNSEKKG